MSVIIHSDVTLSRLLASTQGRNGYGPYSLSNRLRSHLGVTTLKQLLEVRMPRIASVLSLRRDDLNAFMRMLHKANLDFSDQFCRQWLHNVETNAKKSHNETMAATFLQTLRDNDIPLKQLLEEIQFDYAYDFFWTKPDLVYADFDFEDDY